MCQKYSSRFHVRCLYKAFALPVARSLLLHKLILLLNSKASETSCMSPHFCFLKISQLMTYVCFLSLEPSIWSQSIFFLFDHMPFGHSKYTVMSDLLKPLIQKSRYKSYVFCSFFSQRLQNIEPSIGWQPIFSRFRHLPNCIRYVQSWVICSNLLFKCLRILTICSFFSSRKDLKISTAFQNERRWDICLLYACASKILAIISMSPLSAQNEIISAPWLVLFSLFQENNATIHGVCLECWEISKIPVRSLWCYRLCSYLHRTNISFSAQNTSWR
jgi:hypothetical protein